MTHHQGRPGSAKTGLPDFTLVLQPIINVAGGSIHGYEVLSRFLDSQGHALQTLQTIHQLSRSGRIDDFTLALARKLTPLLWRAIEKDGDALFFINLTPAQITGDRCDPVLDLLQDAGVLGHCAFEITETESMPMDAHCNAVLMKLGERSAGVFLDDFGDGYSTLKRLSEMPINGIKLDRSIVSQLRHSERSRVILEGLADICQRLDCQLVAEGVEEAQTHTQIVQAGIRLAQGYWYGRPEAPDYYLEGPGNRPGRRDT